MQGGRQAACIGPLEAISRVAADGCSNKELGAAQMHSLFQLVIQHCDVESPCVSCIIQACKVCSICEWHVL